MNIGSILAMPIQCLKGEWKRCLPRNQRNFAHWAPSYMFQKINEVHESSLMQSNTIQCRLMQSNYVVKSSLRQCDAD